jgi:hypothetical protein
MRKTKNEKRKTMIGITTNRRFLKLLILATALFLCVGSSIAQPALPPRSLTVTATQSLYFGTICVNGLGGTVTVGYDGSRSKTGNVILLPTAPTSTPAIFEIKLCQGRNVIITFDAQTILTGSNGGTLRLDIGPTEKGINGASFITNDDCNFITPMRVGGTLHIPDLALQGLYTGFFTITFNQE